MKKKLIIILLALLFVVPAAYSAEPWSTPSAEETTDAAITAGTGLFHGIIVATDGSNACTVSIYDHASAASGTELIPTTVITSTATDRVQAISISPAVRYHKGIYVDITLGSGAVGYMVYFKSD